MTIRFVYPVKIWNGTKKCLRIQCESEDGQAWFGIEEAIKNYCEKMGLDVANVDWRVSCKNDYESIKAKDSRDWLRQFERLDIEWEVTK